MNAAGASPRLLPALILALAAAAALRAGHVWFGFAGASAQSSVSSEAVSADERATPAIDRGEAETALAPIEQTPSSIEQRLLEHLAERRDALDRREADLETREALLRVAEARLEEKIAIIREERRSLEEVERTRSARVAEDFETLSNAYERMKPRDAARIFEALDDEILVPVAAGMRTQAISGVLAEMAPEKARALTLKLAERARGQPDSDPAPGE
ncbi:MAG: hypothetical protein AAGJ87_07215 [Pseudomonadota bacterium]